MRAASTPRVPASSSLHACSAHSRKQIFPEPSTWAIVRTIIGSRQWHKGAAGRSFIMKFAQVRALIQIMKVRSPDRMSPTNRLVNHAFRVAVDVEEARAQVQDHRNRFRRRGIALFTESAACVGWLS